MLLAIWAKNDQITDFSQSWVQNLDGTHIYTKFDYMERGILGSVLLREGKLLFPTRGSFAGFPNTLPGVKMRSPGKEISEKLPNIGSGDKSGRFCIFCFFFFLFPVDTMSIFLL